MLQQLSAGRLMRKLGRDFDWLTCYISFLGSAMQTEFHSRWLEGRQGGREGSLFCCKILLLWLYIWFIWYLGGPKYLMRFHLQNDKITIQFYKKWEKPRKLPHFVELLEIENIGEHQLFGVENKGYRSCWCWYNSNIYKASLTLWLYCIPLYLFHDKNFLVWFLKHKKLIYHDIF